VANVKATAVLARINFIKQRFGQIGYERVLEALNPSTGERLRTLVLPREWLPLACLTELIEMTERLFGRGDGALCREMARHAADANLTTLYKIFYRVASAGYVLTKASALWNLHYDSGRLEAAESGSKGIKLRIVDFDAPDCTHCRSVFAWAERSVELSGGKEVGVSYAGCRKRGGAACECTVSYR
jgi:hypothetical protein